MVLSLHFFPRISVKWYLFFLLTAGPRPVAMASIAPAPVTLQAKSAAQTSVITVTQAATPSQMKIAMPAAQVT